ncbi:MAG TPA: hypothetical protein GX719_01920 [Gammaproteobacteria bacterium]|nr:hypothetical protein [Gammaproteobacteria bacterium]
MSWRNGLAKQLIQLLNYRVMGIDMSDEAAENIIDLSGERERRVHDLNEKRLQGVRAAFVKALPLTVIAAKPKKKSKKKR